MTRVDKFDYNKSNEAHCLKSVQIRSFFMKKKKKNTPYLDTFHAVIFSNAKAGIRA